ncbi:UNVERIFIED_CONTAM: MLO-like protein 13 [Sesamum calycinum]|uniref:MLO-like protein n=1 Tax=Sesamum calycinum TaxID=2727403 RepID=A0AAW2J571_9LAMI
MAGGESGRSFEYTPTWVVAVVCFIIVFISVLAERALHKLGKCFQRKNQEALFEALQKVKEELMLLGFISLLLTVFQGTISRFCIPDHVANIMLPCKLKSTTAEHLAAKNVRRLLAEGASQQCSEGQVPFLSLEALHQLHIFIFVLAVVYVISCASTMVLGGIKFMLLIFTYKSSWTDGPILEKISRNKLDGSILQTILWEHCPSNPNYDFHKYMLRTLEQDFKKIIGISWYLWLFVVIFLLLNIAGWHAYFWLSFLPLALLLIVGAKLEHIITELAQDAAERAGDAEGTRVRPSDELFWFHRPAIVLYLIHFILFQNSFEIAFFFWIWATYGFRSCIMEGLHFIIPRLVIGVIVQVLCSYSTLPLYALVTQMGSMFKQTVFDEFTQELLRTWAKESRPGSSAGRRASSRRLTTEPTDPISHSQESVVDGPIAASEVELSTSHMPSSWNN